MRFSYCGTSLDYKICEVAVGNKRNPVDKHVSVTLEMLTDLEKKGGWLWRKRLSTSSPYRIETTYLFGGGDLIYLFYFTV